LLVREKVKSDVSEAMEHRRKEQSAEMLRAPKFETGRSLSGHGANASICQHVAREDYCAAAQGRSADLTTRLTEPPTAAASHPLTVPQEIPYLGTTEQQPGNGDAHLYSAWNRYERYVDPRVTPIRCQWPCGSLRLSRHQA
jgi:hypothetical protein